MSGGSFVVNPYRVVWLFVFFDLPTRTGRNRKDAARFRKDLEGDGFRMMQYSVYIRFCGSRENARMHIGRVRAFVPSPGMVSILCVTDRQYGDIVNIWGAVERKLPGTPQQLEIF
jgi:CRISPR-associated protein Cas2